MTDTPEMVERIAVMLLARVNAPESEIYAVAREIIGAMREPTPDMVIAAYATWDKTDGLMGPREFIDIWQAAHDAALQAKL